MKTSSPIRKLRKTRFVLRRRSAFLLLAVLLVVSAVTLASMAFMQSMLLGHQESRLTGESIQARYAADSGIDAARLFVASNRSMRLQAGGTFNNPNTFQAIPVLQSKDPANPCNYTLIAPNLDEDGEYSSVRYGLMNESARLNLNVLPMIDSAMSGSAALLSAVAGAAGGGAAGGGASLPTAGLGSGSMSGASSDSGAAASIGRDLLMALPAMTEDVADAILDFIDADSEPREYGCELEYYSQLPNPYAPINGPLTSIEQLLLVRGVTPQLLFGLDQNRNGVLEAAEENAAMMGTAATGMNAGMANTSTAGSNAASVSPPDLGWAMYLTLYSKEKNVTSDGLPRVNLNGQDLNLLRTDLSAAMGDDIATFVIAYRMLGSNNGGGGSGSGGAVGGGGGGENAPGGGGPGGAGPGGGGPGGRGGPGGAGPGGRGGPGGAGPGGGPGGRGGPGGGGPGGGGAPRGGRSAFAMFHDLNFSPMLSLVAMPQPPAGRGGQGAGGGRGGPGQAGGRGQGGPGQGGRGQGGPGQGGRGQGGDRNGPGQGGPGGGGGAGGGPGAVPGTGGSGTRNAQARPWSAAAFDALNIDMSQSGGRIGSVLELIDATFTATVNNEEVTFQSPLTSAPAQMALYLPMLMDKVTSVEAPMLPGRININEAPREILAGLPGMTTEILDQLIEARASSADTENRKLETWPMVEGIISLQQMRTIAPLVTAGGDVMRVQSVGYFEQSAGFARTEAVIDGSGQVPVIVLYRKLDHLGRGFSQSVLGQRAMGTVSQSVATPQ